MMPIICLCILITLSLIFGEYFFRNISFTLNIIFPKYYLCEETKTIYKLVRWWGYDKHSAVVAEMMLYGDEEKRIKNIGDEAFKMKRINRKIVDILYGV